MIPLPFPTFATPSQMRLPAGGAELSPPGRESFVHRAALVLAWLAIASGAIVFSEPAPTDVLTMALIVLLPVIGLVAFRPAILGFGVVMFVIAAGGFVAAALAIDNVAAAKHTAISLYLAIAAVVLAAFVARRPAEHARLLLDAQLAGAILAALAAIAGYFNLLPGAGEMLTRFGRASGTFKDPNVLGPYLVIAIVYALHGWLERPLRRGVLHAGAFAILSLALLLSFSRGAWAAAAIATALYLYLRFVTEACESSRQRIIGLCLTGLVAAIPAGLLLLSSEQVASLLGERASLTQSYDVGPEGRFGGQRKALDVIAASPLGIGAAEFTKRHHPEDVHNVYLSMFLNAGWIGGSLFLALVAAVLAVGFSRAIGAGPTDRLMLVSVTALAAIAIEGAIIDTDHWRHLYLLLALIVGLASAGEKRKTRQAAIKADRRPILLRPVIVLAPTRRNARILRPVTGRHRTDPAGNNRAARLVGPVRPKRPARLIGPARPKRAARISAAATRSRPWS